MAEEHRCEAPEGHRLCANNCGFIGSPATMNLCSKCYRDIHLKEQDEASTKSTIEAALSSSTASSPPSITSSPPSPTVVSIPRVSSTTTLTVTETVVVSGLVSAAVKPNRCAACRKRVGLTGFKCRCEVTFCGAHRYPEKHACSFDFKTVGREEIARANPVIKAAKLERI